MDLHVVNPRSSPPAQNVPLGEDLSSSYQQRNGMRTWFPDVESLLDFVTERWRERWVTTAIDNETTLKILSRRPSFILISIDAPVGVRWHRFKQR